jgi:hypothetical protein
MARLFDAMIRKPKHSNFNMSRANRFTMAPGLLYPFYWKPVMSQDICRWSWSSIVKTFPTLAPVMGSFKLQIDDFFVPYRLYVSEFQRNSSLIQYLDSSSTKSGFSDVVFPCFTFSANGNAYAAPFFPSSEEGKGLPVASGSILNCLGFPIGATPAAPGSSSSQYQLKGVRFNAIPFLAFWDIYRNYYVNRQENTYSMMRVSGSVGSRSLIQSRLSLSLLDEFFENFQHWSALGDSVRDIFATGAPDVLLFQQMLSSMLNSDLPLAGLPCRTYLPDYFSNFINAAGYQLYQQQSRIVVGDDGGTSFITNDQLVLNEKMTKLLGRAWLSGGRYSEYLRTQFGQEGVPDCDIPQYCGSTSVEITFDEVVSTAETSETNNGPLGSLGGRGRARMFGRTRVFKPREYGIMMSIASIVPRADYSDQFSRDWLVRNLTDLYVPALDSIGMQDLMDGELNFANTPVSISGQSSPFLSGLAKHPAWMEYMTDVNRNFGDFAGNLSYWVLNRPLWSRNSSPVGLTNFTSYVNPDIFNQIFADTSATAQNFLVQIGYNALYNRPISKQVMPTL